MAWFYLIAAILLEVCGTTSMKLSNGFSNALPSVMIFVFYGLSMMCLTVAVKTIDVSIAYAIWSGLGTAVIVVIGVAAFGETMTPVKLGALALIVVGVVSVNLDGI